MRNIFFEFLELEHLKEDKNQELLAINYHLELTEGSLLDWLDRHCLCLEGLNINKYEVNI